ncbi:MAG TPA: hypothetical protein P5137_10765, partial [Candidatus Brocadiia bacterium]|nr:hypothetical protein [Candidatus Brocadiia bacterium]
MAQISGYSAADQGRFYRLGMHFYYTRVCASFSHFAYRNVPTSIWEWLDSDNAYRDKRPLNIKGRARLYYHRPYQTLATGEPVFKTQKQLSGRALASDSFGRLLWWDKDTPQKPGDGYYGHRDGYNVLYGDGSARYWGDPQLRLVYWPECGFVKSSWDGVTIRSGMYTNVITDYYAEYQSGDTHNAHNLRHGQYVWHQFDEANGIDAGVDNNAKLKKFTWD